MQFKRLDKIPVSFDGDAFESLIRTLLNDCFPGNWEATPRTRDGGKDVVDRSIPGDIAWAECKMYRRPISLQVVSNTLVMAVVETGVRRILFFSYSDMTDNAKRYLARFALYVGKTIQVFDGELLEELIVRSPPVMASYFPDVALPSSFTVMGHQPIVKAYFSSDVHVSHQQLAHIEGADNPREYSIPIYTPCLYELTLAAQHTNGILEVGFVLSRDEFKNFEILNLDQVNSYTSIALNSGQTLCLPIYVAPLVSGPLSLPQLSLQCDNLEPIELPSVRLNVSAFEQPILIGKSIHETLLDFESLVSSGSVNRVFAVSGHSGVGKSRFMDEATTRLLKNGYQIHYFDGISCQNELRFGDGVNQQDELSANFVRSLLCSVWRLPDPASFVLSQVDSSPSETVSAGDFGQVCDIVYRWDTRQILTDRNVIHMTLLQGFCTCRSALVIDNVQTFPEPVIGVLQAVFGAFAGLPGQSCMLLSFNEDDLVFNSAASAWLSMIRTVRNDTVRHLNLPDFSRPLAEEFVDNLFERGVDGKLFSELYPALLDKILDKIILRPLDLWQFAKGLEDRGAICTGRDVFTIVDFEEFNCALQVLSPDRESLLNWRMARFRSVPDVALAVAAITYLGPLTLREMAKLVADDNVCKKLVQASILRVNREHKLEFYHPSLTRHFTNDTKHGALVEYATKHLLYERATRCGTKFINSARWFGLAFDVDGDIMSAIPAALAQFTGQDFSGYSPLHLAADRLLTYVESNEDLNVWWSLLPALAGAAHIAAQGAVSVLRARTDYLYALASRIAPACPSDNARLTHWTHIIREMAGYMASAKEESGRADRLLTQALSSLDRANDVTTDLEIWRAQAHLLNRRCVTLKNLGRNQDAIAVAQVSLEYAHGHGMIDLVCLNLVDMGYVEYGLQTRNDILLRYWREACTQFDMGHPYLGRDVHDIRLVMGLISGCVAGLSNEFDRALRILDALLLESRERAHWFYQLQGMAAKGTMMMRQALLDPSTTLIRCEQVLELARLLEDMAASMGQAKRYRSALYLQGKAYEALGKRLRASQRYEDAFKVKVSKDVDFEADAIAYDLKRVGKDAPSMPPLTTTFSVGGINLPLP